jgi:hypothetical protein
MKTLSDTIELPKNPLFNCEFPPGHLRPYDAEYKILEELAYRYQNTPYITGYINLFTEREPCSSCQYVIEQFRQMFPNIQLNIYSNSP